MIKLTRLDGTVFYINADLIETVEETPDTHIMLSNGKRYLVLEKTAIILDRIMEFKAAILRRSMPVMKKKYLKRKRLGNFNPVCEL